MRIDLSSANQDTRTMTQINVQYKVNREKCIFCQINLKSSFFCYPLPPLLNLTCAKSAQDIEVTSFQFGR